MTTLLGTDLIVMVVALAAGFAVSYLLLLSRLKALLTERQLKIADQLGALDDAIRALETRLAEHQVSKSSRLVANVNEPSESTDGVRAEEDYGEIAPEIQAVIAAAAVAAVGPDAVVQSVKPALSPWSQQGRVMVQGGHNFRVRR